MLIGVVALRHLVNAVTKVIFSIGRRSYSYVFVVRVLDWWLVGVVAGWSLFIRPVRNGGKLGRWSSGRCDRGGTGGWRRPGVCFRVSVWVVVICLVCTELMVTLAQ